jgi:hypothetical protein
MRARHATALAALGAITLVSTPAADAKFSVSLTAAPARPVVGQPVEVVVRTGVVLPRSHRMWLTAVGPWRDAFGQTFVDRRLMRIGPRAFTATVRLPYAGRWHLIAPSWGGPGASPAPPPVTRTLTVRPRRGG